MNKICILASGFEKDVINHGISAFSLLRDLSAVGCLLRSLIVRINPKWIRFFYKKNWLKHLDQYDTIIVFDCMNCNMVLESIVNNYAYKRVILFFWNPILKATLCNIPKGVEIWSSDYADAQKYGFKYSGQFVFEKNFQDLDKTVLYDLFFVGRNKGRFPLLRKLQSQLAGMGIHSKIIYVDPLRSIISNKYSIVMPYSQVLKELAHSKCVLEIVQKKQLGLTLRAIEAMILQKKLITNNKDIINYNYFDSNRVFVLENESVDLELIGFIESSMPVYPEDIISKYYFSNWIWRIINNIELEDRI